MRGCYTLDASLSIGSQSQLPTGLNHIVVKLLWAEVSLRALGLSLTQSM